jgi:hypothetical protein
VPQRRIVVSSLCGISLCSLSLLPAACDNADPVSPAAAQEAVQTTGPASGVGTLAAGDSLALLGTGDIAYSLAASDFPFSTTLSSWENAFSITQTGTGRSGRFAVSNPSSDREALLAVNNGTGVALSAVAHGTGRAGYYRITNPANSNAALIGDTQGSGAGILAYTTGTGPGARFLVNNASNSSPALQAETVGTGNLLELLASGSPVGHIDGNGGLSLKGAVNAGGVPAEGAGARLMWYPGKGAYRAGYVTGTTWDDANIGHYSTASGLNTTASGTASSAAGWQATATGHQAVAMGNSTTASGSQSFAMGYNSTAGGTYSVAMGYQANATGNSSVALGHNVTASGLSSFALGRAVSTNGKTGSFVLGDASTTTLMQPAVDNYFMARFESGYLLFTNAAMNAGVFLTAGDGSWNTVSDEAMKENFRQLDGESVLEKIAAMGIREWNYRSQDASIRHVGPTAQDFYAAFGLGTSDRSIATVDADGIALAGVKALERRTREQADEIEVLRAENRDLRQRLQRLENALLDH